MRVIILKNNGLEKHDLIVRTIRLISVPLFNTLPSFFVKKIMKRTSDDASVVIDNVGSTHALEIMYTRHRRNLFKGGFWYGIGNLFWHSLISQSKAARNRLKIVEQLLEKEILHFCRNKKPVTILSIGGGSCRAIIQTVNKTLKCFPNCNIKVINIDKSVQALDLGKKITEDFGVYNKFNWINTTASKMESFISLDSIDIIEMVGLLDYFSHEKAIHVIRMIYRCLKNNGLFITGNVYPNREMRFISKIGWPDMYYRKVEDIEKILSGSGFNPEKGEIIFEPLKSHIVVKIKK